MRVWRGFTLTLWVVILTIFTAFCIHYYALNTTILDASNAKKWLAESSTYEKLRDEALAPYLTSALKQQLPANQLLDQSLVQNALQDTLPRDELARRFDPTVTSIYRWLDSKEDEVTFSISLADKKNAFIQALERAVSQKISTFPRCEGYQYPPEEALLNTQCLVRGLTANEAVQALMGYIRASDVTKAATFSNETLTIPPEQARALKQIPMYLNFLWVLNLVSIAVIVFVSLLVVITRKWLGVAAFGLSLTLAGLIVLVTGPMVLTLQLPETAGILSVLSSAVETLLPRFITASRNLALSAMTIGIMLVAAAIIWRMKRGTHGKH